MPLESFRLEQDTAAQNLRAPTDKESPDSVSISFNGSKIEIGLLAEHHRHAPGLAGAFRYAAAGYPAKYSVAAGCLISGLLALALFGYSTFRSQPGRQSDVPVAAGTSNELRVLRALNEEIVSVLPLGAAGA
ncbi:Sensor-like histidine kinase RcsD [Leclercia adecarboxylata]|uniref:Sensor-like histidine kinase RcsD n=1 Tax=Leclercia adecarboxylata TaxID=83655 RepID=A0A4U9I8H2_9ENTR|nr:Sensor-like histidine kinase RcsD [Leclercia adecarboxylata]